MAVADNGLLMNGSTSKTSSRPVHSPRRPPRQPSRGIIAWLISTPLRLLIWYILITCVFRCPSSSSGLKEDSPRLCKPCITVVSYLTPYTEPYYDTYAAPYVDRARPYAAQFNHTFLNPISRITKKNFDSHAAPRIASAKKFCQRRWEKALLPQVETAQNKANEIYGDLIAPRIEKVFLAVEPHYGAAKTNAIQSHQKHILPALQRSRPYLEHIYTASQSFLIDIGIPYARWIWSCMVLFVDETLRPQLRALYQDNVKPQLVMISERITKYQEGRKIKASLERVESSMLATSVSTSDSAPAATPEIISETPIPTEQASTVKSKLSGPEKIAAARPKVTADLHSWQEKFATAADRGSEDLQERVAGIIGGLIESEVNDKARSLLAALNETVENEVAEYKSRIIGAVSALPDKSSAREKEKGEKELQEAIRQCANKIRNKASAIREWHAEFEVKITQRAAAAAESTLDVLDGIRDLGLQEIGMRWAWMDGVTYKDWAKYHELKKQLAQWRDEVRHAATKHEMIGEAKKASDEVLESAMETASDAAKELVRLKDVGKWKIQARDPSNNFESRPMLVDAAHIASAAAGRTRDVSQDVGSGSHDASGSMCLKGNDLSWEDPALVCSVGAGVTDNT